MSMELKGKVLQLLPQQSGMGKKGPWKKQEFILEIPGQYPKKVCLSIWGDKVDQYNVQDGDDLTVSVDLESREYNGRWYTEARAWKIEKSRGGNEAPFPSDEPFSVGDEPTDDIPF